MAYRKPRTRAELEHGVEGTDYGMRQMLFAGAFLSGAGVVPMPPPWVPWVPNALIESFLANARRIAWFLKGYKDDVYAGDYLPTWVRPTNVGWIIGKVSLVLSHAKYEGKPAPYRYREMVDPLADGMLTFVAGLEAAESEW